MIEWLPSLTTPLSYHGGRSMSNTFFIFFEKMFFDTFCRIVILGTCVPFRLEQDHLITGGYPPSNTFLKKFKKILNRTNVRFSFKFQYWDARAGAGRRRQAQAHGQARTRAHAYIPHSRVCHCENVNNENAYIYTSQKRKRLHVKAFTLSTSFDKFQQIDVKMSNESAYFRQISQNRK